MVLIAVSGVALIRLVIWGLIGSCTALAPDEGGYFQLFQYINKTQKIRPTLHWAGTPEWVLQIFFTPAKIFAFLGLGEFQAFRLQSILLAVASTLIVLFSLKNLSFYERFQSLDVKNRRALGIFLALACLMPTNIIWTTLGLREPFIYFSLAMTLFSFSDYMRSKSKYSLWLIVFVLGLIILGYTKFYLYVIVLLSILISLIVLKSQLRSKLIIVILLTLCTLPIFSKQINEVSRPTIRFSNVHLTLDLIPDFNSPKLPSMTYNQLLGCRKAETAGPLLRASIFFADTFLPKRVETANSQNAIDEPSATALRNDENLRGELNLLNLPIGLLGFLLFPFSILDSGLFGLLGLFEAILWLPLYALFGTQIWRSRKEIRQNPILAASLSFISIFVVFSALSEVNFGTSLRHRSVLLAPMVLAALSIWRNRPSRDNS